VFLHTIGRYAVNQKSVTPHKHLLLFLDLSIGIREIPFRGISACPNSALALQTLWGEILGLLGFAEVRGQVRLRGHLVLCLWHVFGRMNFRVGQICTERGAVPHRYVVFPRFHGLIIREINPFDQLFTNFIFPLNEFVFVTEILQLKLPLKEFLDPVCGLTAFIEPIN
jgi:hypothetical protein